MFKISDRVKETTSTTGTGSITLGGSVGAFQTFLQGIGDGNTTYYTIENGANFEIGQGTLSSNVLSRDIVFTSTNSNDKISLLGTSTVFCTLPASQAFVEHPSSGIKVDGSSSFLDSVNIKSLSVSGIVNSGQSISMLDSVVLGNTNSNSITTNSILTSGANTTLGGSNIVGSLNVGGNALVSGSLSSAGGGDLIVDSVQVSDAMLSSGLLTLERSGAGNFFHAYSDTQTIGLHTDSNTSQLWKLGLKANPTDDTAAPTVGYVFGKDGQVGVVSNANNYVTLTDDIGLAIYNNSHTILNASSATGVTVEGSVAAQPVLTVQSPAAASEDIQRWQNSSSTILAKVDKDGNIFSGNTNLVSDIRSNSASGVAISGWAASTFLTSDDDSIANFASGLAVQNEIDITTVSGLLYNDASLSGYFESRVDSTDSDIVTVSGLLYDDTAISGYFETRADSADVGVSAVSGIAVYASGQAEAGGNALPLASGAKITANTNLINSVSGWAGSTITNEVASLVDSAPGTLDTLNELAAAINDDANIASTLTTLISNTSGNLQGQITSNDTDILAVSGLLYNDASLSGYFEGRADSNQTNIATNTTSINTVSGLIPNNTFNITAGDGSNYTIDGMGLNSASDPTMYMHKGHTYILNKTFSGHPFAVSTTDGGSVYSDADGNNIEIGSAAGSVTFEVPQNAPDKLYYYCTAHPSNMKGLIYTTTDGSTSGYFESRVDTNAADIVVVSGIAVASTLTAGSGITIDGANKINVHGGSGHFIDLTIENPGDTTNDITGNALIVNANNANTDARIAFFANKATYHATDHHGLQIRGNTYFNGAYGASLVGRNGGDAAYAPFHLRGGNYINGVSIQEDVVKIIGPTLFYDNLGSRNANTIVNIVRGAAGQAVNLHEWQNSSETTLSSIDRSGIYTNIIGSSGTDALRLRFGDAETNQTVASNSSITGVWLDFEDGSEYTAGTVNGNGIILGTWYNTAKSAKTYLQIIGNQLKFELANSFKFKCDTTDFTLNTNVIPLSAVTKDIGAEATPWKNIYASGISVSGVELRNYVPATTTNKLYNDGGTLKFNGSAVGGGGGGSVTGGASGVAFFADDGALTSGNDFTYDSGNNHIILQRDGSRMEFRGSDGQKSVRIGDSDSDATQVGSITLYVNDNSIGTFTANSSGPTLRTHTASDNLLIKNSSNTTFATFNGSNGDQEFLIEPHAATKIGQVIKGASSQSANLQEWQNDSDVVLASVAADGSIASSGTISASGGLLLNNLVPNSTTNALYNDGGTLKFNGSAVGGGGGGGGAVSAVANGVDNRVATFSSADALNGEANLTFDGSTLAVNGAFTATTKSFLIDHPTKEGMKLQYASLEGPENGVYIRGTSGSNIITLPEYWSTLVDQSTVTVSLTPIGHYQALYIKEKGKNYIKVGGTKGSYDYVVYGERKDVEKLKVEW